MSNYYQQFITEKTPEILADSYNDLLADFCKFATDFGYTKSLPSEVPEIGTLKLNGYGSPQLWVNRGHDGFVSATMSTFGHGDGKETWNNSHIIKEHWERYKSDSTLSKDDIDKAYKKLEQQQQQDQEKWELKKQAEEKEKHDKYLWQKSQYDQLYNKNNLLLSQYFKKKHVSTTPHQHYARYDTTTATTYIEAFNAEGEACAIQRIADNVFYDQNNKPAGNKRINGKSGGAWSVIGCTVEELLNQEKILICEGYATGLSLYDAHKTPVLVAFNAGNIFSASGGTKSVNSFIEYFHSIKGGDTLLPAFTICADNDQWVKNKKGVLKDPNDTHPQAKNAGVLVAHSCAFSLLDRGISCDVLVPTFDTAHNSTNPTDFNDLHVLQGLEAVLAIPFQEPDKKFLIKPVENNFTVSAPFYTPPLTDYGAPKTSDNDFLYAVKEATNKNTDIDDILGVMSTDYFKVNTNKYTGFKSLALDKTIYLHQENDVFYQCDASDHTIELIEKKYTAFDLLIALYHPDFVTGLNALAAQYNIDKSHYPTVKSLLFDIYKEANVQVDQAIKEILKKFPDGDEKIITKVVEAYAEERLKTHNTAVNGYTLFSTKPLSLEQHPIFKELKVETLKNQKYLVNNTSGNLMLSGFNKEGDRDFYQEIDTNGVTTNYGDFRGKFGLIGCTLPEAFTSNMILISANINDALYLNDITGEPVLVAFEQDNICKIGKLSDYSNAAYNSFKALFFEQKQKEESTDDIPQKTTSSDIEFIPDPVQKLKKLPTPFIFGYQEQHKIIHKAAFALNCNVLILKNALSTSEGIAEVHTQTKKIVSNTGDSITINYGEFCDLNIALAEAKERKDIKQTTLFKKIARMTGGSYTHMSKRYMGNYPIQEGINLVSGALGFGKSYSALNSVQANEKSLIISHLVTLTHDIKSKQNKLFEENNKDAKNINYQGMTAEDWDNSPHISTCIDSLYKMTSDLGVKKVDRVIFDECTQGLRALATRGDMGKKNDDRLRNGDAAKDIIPTKVLILKTLRALLINTKITIMMDAHIDDIFCDTLINMDLGKPIHITHNTAVLPRTMNIITDNNNLGAKKGGGVWQVLTDRIKDNKNVFYTSNSKLRCSQLFYTLTSKRNSDKTLKEDYKPLTAAMDLLPEYGEGKVLLVTSNTSDDKAVKEFFSDVNKYAKDYKLIIGSPSVATGISLDEINNVPCFSTVIGDFNAKVNMPSDCLQAVSRVRGSPDLFVFIDPASFATYKDEKAVEEANAAANAATAKTCQDNTGNNVLTTIDDTTGLPITVEENPQRQPPPFYQKLKNMIQTDTNNSMVGFYQKFLRQAAEEGYTFKYHNVDSQSSFKDLVNKKANQIMIEAVIDTPISEADQTGNTENDDDKLTLKKLNTRIQQRVLANFKPNDLNEYYNYIKQDIKGELSAKLSLFEKAAGFVEVKKENLSQVDYRHEVLKVELYKRLLEATGFSIEESYTHSNFIYSAKSKSIDDFCKWANKNAKALEGALGKFPKIPDKSRIRRISNLLKNMGLSQIEAKQDGQDIRWYELKHVEKMYRYHQVKDDPTITANVLQELTFKEINLHPVEDGLSYTKRLITKMKKKEPVTYLVDTVFLSSIKQLGVSITTHGKEPLLKIGTDSYNFGHKAADFLHHVKTLTIGEFNVKIKPISLLNEAGNCLVKVTNTGVTLTFSD